MKTRYDITASRLQRLADATDTNVIKRINRQLVRWFDLDPLQLHISRTGFSVIVDDSSPSEWCFLLVALDAGSSAAVNMALLEVEKTRKSDITRRLGAWKPKVSVNHGHEDQDQDQDE